MNTLKIKICFLVPAFALACSTAHADENALRRAFQTKFPKMKVESVNKTPFANLYQVVLDGQIVYTDDKATYVLSGDLLDMRGAQPRNLTQEATNKLSATTLAQATGQAVKRVKGNGKRVIYTLEDPNCGYCKELQKELGKVNDVTIYTFLWPILSQDSVEKSKAIWCSSDRAKAWEEAMLKGAALQGKRDCETPLAKNAELAQRFGLRGTPAVYLANGQQIGGYLTADKIEAALASR